MSAPTLTRSHRSRLLQIWRSAGWPCKDGLEIDLLAAGLLRQQDDGAGRETLKLTEAGIELLAESRQRGLRSASAHDRLAQRFALHLMDMGRIVWRELSLRAQVDDEDAPPAATATTETAVPDAPAPTAHGLWSEDETPAPAAIKRVWRMARPDLFSVRQTSVERYLQPMVHEIKFSRADLLSDLRHAAKRQAYQWLCSEVYYVFPAGVAKPNEIPTQFGVWVMHGDLDEGQFELLRPARHQPCKLPFAVWLALAKATPLQREAEPGQGALADVDQPPAQLS
ncbi:MAG: hypothetical protein ACK4S6_05205 [Roseateles asaccharophilus]|uniref:Uncharacterized protein n=1 Tax=Roseateles asaccharophilus TaxID=582607 RepID=A0A4R6N8Q9_9BURK|nr:hypothetical protein [Roseateles asaccharophilus]MDN3543980.1 hypothetical protein [Roseateles asaccharophilus]TDP11640.1 hypothetical protein DFR39_10211 [Roseateles asaccharophilus]